MYIFIVLMARCAMDLRSKNNFRVKGGGVLGSSVLSLNGPSDRDAHRNGQSVQCIGTAWNQNAASVRVRCSNELVQPSSALQ